MTRTRFYTSRFLRVAVVAGALAGLSGCADGIELQGGIFDALGVSGSSDSKSAEPKVADRAPLVVPPDMNRLPPPGTPPQAAAAAASWPQDPESVKLAKAAEQKKVIAKYCNDKDFWLASKPREFERMTNNGALCQTGLGKYFNKKVN